MSRVKLVFFDNSLDIITTYREKTLELLEPLIEYVVGDMENIIQEQPIHILVCATTSEGDILDAAPESGSSPDPELLSLIIAKRISRVCSGVLPIGSSILTLTPQDSLVKLLACIPLIDKPDQPVGAINVYWAIRGLLQLLDQVCCHVNSGEIVVAIPCCLTSQASQATHASHVVDAISDHYKDNIAICDPNCNNVHVIANEKTKWAYILSDHACPL